MTEIAVLGPCNREGCDVTITAVVDGEEAHVVGHECTGKIYTKKNREYKDGH